MRVAVIARFSTFADDYGPYQVVGVVEDTFPHMVDNTVSRLNAENPSRDTTEYRVLDRYQATLTGHNIRAIGTDVPG